MIQSETIKKYTEYSVHMEKIKSFFQKNQISLSTLFLIVLCVVSYYPVLRLSFFQDDLVWFSAAKVIRTDVTQLFTLKISHFFMPMVYAYFTAAFTLFGLSAFPYYLLSILLHMANTILLQRILLKLSHNVLAATLGALIFATLRYPLEAVAWISAATVLLTAFFLLLSSYFWISSITTTKKISYLLCLFFSFCLFLTKEWSVLLLPFLGLITLWQANNEPKPIVFLRKAGKKILPIFGMLFFYLVSEYLIQHQANVLLQKNYYALGWHIIPNIFGNIFLTFLPLTNSIHSHPILFAVFSASAILVSLIFISRRKSHAIFLLPILWLFVAFLPTAAFTWDPFVSRYSYLPGISIAMILTLLWIKTSEQHKWRYLLPILAFYCVGNIFFIHRVIAQYYVPIHRETRAYIQALENTSLNNTQSVIVSDNTPAGIKMLFSLNILPDILFATKNIEQKNVHLLPKGTHCTSETNCLEWIPTSHSIKSTNP